MPYGWAGTTLEVDLTKGKIEKRETDPGLAQQYLSGKGLNARILWDRVPPEVDALSPDNLFIVGAGLLSGTLVPGASHTCLTFKSPVTNIHCYSSMGGFFSAEMRYAGYDQIIVTGKSPTPVHLWIKDDQVELRDASSLWGKSPHETMEQIRHDAGTDRVQTICIGPAGEKQIFHASVEQGTGASSSRGGSGAVMGGKNLKAITVWGTKDITIANSVKLVQLSEYILERSGANRKGIVERSGLSYVRTLVRDGDFGNFSGMLTPELQAQIKDIATVSQQHIDKARVREVACSNCSIRCKHEYRSNGGFTFMKCQGWFAPMVATQILDCAFSEKFMTLCEKYGMDIITTANSVAFASDLYQRGILTKADVDGLDLQWKNAEAALNLVDKIGKREGVGEMFANGLYRAARQIGKGAENYVHAAKKLDLIPFRIYYRHHFALMSAINEKGDPTMLDSSITSMMLHRPKEEKEAHVKAGWFPYPKEYEKYLMAGVDATMSPSHEVLARFKSYDMESYTLADSCGICRYWMQYWLFPPISTHAMVGDLISAVTGMELDEERTGKIAKRIVHLVRAYNVREGLRKKDDFESVPKYIFERPQKPPEVKLDPEEFSKMLDIYYQIRGWDKDGVPTRQTLAEYGLDDVAQDLAKRKIISG